MSRLALAVQVTNTVTELHADEIHQWARKMRRKSRLAKTYAQSKAAARLRMFSYSALMLTELRQSVRRNGLTCDPQTSELPQSRH